MTTLRSFGFIGLPEVLRLALEFTTDSPVLPGQCSETSLWVKLCGMQRDHANAVPQIDPKWTSPHAVAPEFIALRPRRILDQMSGP
jgi:hypothetical protein